MVTPSEWKHAKVVPIFKSGNTTEYANYRPISILSLVSKIIEKAVHKQLLKHFESNNLLTDVQFGYRSNRSTEETVTLFIDDIRSSVDKGELVGAVFLDLSKAFDTISHAKLLEKLPSYGIRSTELKFITDYSGA